MPRRTLTISAIAILVTACGATQAPTAPTSMTHSTAVADVSVYDSVLLRLDPLAYYHVAGVKESETDLVGHHPGDWTSSGTGLSHVRLPDGTEVVDFHSGDYLTIPTAPGFSIPTTGKFTVIAWIRPETLQFVDQQGSGYVHWLGKGEHGAQEWTLRMYSLLNAEGRPNRISGYAFNLNGGKGSGAYVQDPVHAGHWMMIGFEVDTTSSQQYRTGWVSIFKDGVQRAEVGLDQFGVTPQSGPAPVRIGTRDLKSFFQGGIGDVAIFDHLIPTSDMQRLYRVMTTGGTSGS